MSSFDPRRGVRWCVHVWAWGLLATILSGCPTPAQPDAGRDGDADHTETASFDSPIDLGDVPGAAEDGVVEDVSGSDSVADADAQPSDARDSGCAGRTCGGRCVDPQTDVNNCGDCGVACTAPANASASCVRGVCGYTCSPGYVLVAGACVALPRPLAPLSTATVTSRRPRLRWVPAAGGDGTRVELCADRACTTSLGVLDVTSSSAAPSADLPPGVVFWRLRRRVGASVDSAAGPTWQFVVGARSAPLGVSFGTRLDVDGDGFADAAVGADFGEAYIYRGGVGGLATSGTPVPRPTGGSRYFGHDLASAGDVNGDGYADLVIADNDGGMRPGRVYVLAGSASGLVATPLASLAGPTPASELTFGASVASAGDVNGDGYADVVVGAGAAGGFRGGAYVYLGGPGPVAPRPAVELAGPPGMASFGREVAGAGDVNGDGFGDIIVGAPSPSLTVGPLPGAVYLFLGSATGTATSPSATLAGPDGPRANFGSSVAGAGDVNGDGYADVVIGADEANRAHVYHGGSGGLASTGTTLDGPPPGTGFRYIVGEVSGGGDVDGDGYADVFVGIFRNLESDGGRAAVYLGSATGVAASPAVLLSEPTPTSGLYGAVVSVLGDVDGDHFDDLAVGAESANSGRGNVYVYLGAATLRTAPAATLAGPFRDSYLGHSLAWTDPAAWCRPSERGCTRVWWRAPRL